MARTSRQQHHITIRIATYEQLLGARQATESGLWWGRPSTRRGTYVRDLAEYRRDSDRRIANLEAVALFNNARELLKADRPVRAALVRMHGMF